MARCYKCGLEISFEILPSGKYRPINIDGSEHWDLCKEKRAKSSGKFYKPISSGFKNKLNSAYNGSIPPWEFNDFIYCVGR